MTIQINYLHKRASLIAAIRAFFAERNVTEVDTPLLRAAPVTDPYIEALTSTVNDKIQYLQTSPEYAMKQLLAEGSGDIYQICKAFRKDEVGRLHNPEFTMLEWYRIGFDDNDLMQEMSDLCQCVLGCDPVDKISYREVFEKYLGIDPHVYSTSSSGLTGGSLGNLVKQHCGEIQGFDLSPSPPTPLPQGARGAGYCQDQGQRQRDKARGAQLLDHTTALQLLFSQVIEPELGKKRPVLIYDFPKDQAALARLKTDQHGAEVAARFELYYQGIELANGYWELTDPVIQRKRFEADLAKRAAQELPRVPVDEDLLKALDCGLPDCAGVALGLDRLIMLALKAKSISDVMCRGGSLCPPLS